MTLPVERLDYSNVNGFKNQMLDFIAQGHNRIVLDMTRVEAMDSKGLSAFLFLSRAVGTEGRIVLAGVREEIRRILILTRTDRVLAVFDNLPAALDGVQD